MMFDCKTVLRPEEVEDKIIKRYAEKDALYFLYYDAEKKELELIVFCNGVEKYCIADVSLESVQLLAARLGHIMIPSAYDGELQSQAA